MTTTHPIHPSRSARDASAVCGSDSGIAAGMVVVDANRPTPRAGAVPALPTSAGGAPH